jgi:2-haloacid dehalogenase
VKYVTFDCFGTLVSWQRGFPLILRRVAGERAEELAQAYHRFEAEVQSGEYRTYRAVLAEALDRAATSIGLPLGADERDVLAHYWDEQPVFEDVGPALGALRGAGWQLVALTNCDEDLFARTQRTLPVQLDFAVTAESVRAYKPALEHFRRFDERTKGRAQWVHVACSWFHDIAPARAYGVPRIWIDRDRTGDEPSAATAVLPSLDGLTTALEAAGVSGAG